MIIIITGASHTGKTKLAQYLLEKYKYPYLSLDHLKMGLIRSKQTDLTVYDDEELTQYLQPIVVEIIKTAIENKQNLIVEGCYISPDWRKNFTDEYLSEISFICLVMSEMYIKEHFADILSHASDIEARLCDDLTPERALEENNTYRRLCEKYGEKYVLIDGNYSTEAISEMIK